MFRIFFVILIALAISGCASQRAKQRATEQVYVESESIAIAKSRVDQFNKKIVTSAYKLNETQSYIPNGFIWENRAVKQCDYNGFYGAFVNHALYGESVKDYLEELNKVFPVRYVTSYNSRSKYSNSFGSPIKVYAAVVGDGAHVVFMNYEYDSRSEGCKDRGDRSRYTLNMQVSNPVEKPDVVEIGILLADLDPEKLIKTQEKLKQIARNQERRYQNYLSDLSSYNARRAELDAQENERNAIFTSARIGKALGVWANEHQSGGNSLSSSGRIFNSEASDFNSLNKDYDKSSVSVINATKPKSSRVSKSNLDSTISGYTFYKLAECSYSVEEKYGTRCAVVVSRVVYVTNCEPVHYGGCEQFDWGKEVELNVSSVFTHIDADIATFPTTEDEAIKARNRKLSDWQDDGYTIRYYSR